MGLSEDAYQAAQDVIVASAATLPDELNKFIGGFIGAPFSAAPGSVQDGDGKETERFASVIHTGDGGACDTGAFAADSVAAVVDASGELTLENFRVAYGRVAVAKQLRKTPLARTEGGPRTSVTLGLIVAARSALSLEAIAEELERLNTSVAGEHRPDMVVVASTGVISYAVQFPSESVSADFLPPGDGALEAYTPPMYVVMVMRATGEHSLNKMLAFLLGHLGIFSPGAKLPKWNEILGGVSKHVVTLSGYQYNQRGELLPVPREQYNDRYLPPRHVRVEDQKGEVLATLQFLPWQDGGAILLRGKLPLDGLMVFLGPEKLRRAGVIRLRDAQLSYVLPITFEDFREMLARLQRQSNMAVRPDETSWTVKKFADEGSSSPFMARLFIGMLRLRDAIFPEPGTRDGFDKAFDVILTSLMSARTSAQDIARLWPEHAAKVASGEIARLERTNIHVDESVDKELGDATESFLNAATRALKYGTQGVAAELGVNIGFLFQKQVHFERGLAALQGTDAPLADYLRQARAWSERLVGCRNAVEHDGWRLPVVTYARDGSGVKAREPLIDGEPISEFVPLILDRLMCFAEEVTAHCLQRRLPVDISFTEVPLAGRREEMPLRFTVTLARGGLLPWTIAFHASAFEDT